MKKAWVKEHEGCPMYVLCRKLQCTRESIRKWNGKKVGDLLDSTKNEVAYTTYVQEQLDADSCNQILQELATSAREEAQKAQKAEGSIIRQKSRVQWLKEGDLNSRFFYSTLKQRRLQNSFHSLDVNGISCSNQDILKNHIVEFY